MGLDDDDNNSFSQIGTRVSEEKSCENGFQHLAKVQPVTSIVPVTRLYVEPLAKKNLNKSQASDQPVHEHLVEFKRPVERRRELMKHRTFSNPLDYSSVFRKLLYPDPENSESKPNKRTQFFASLLEGDTQDQYETKKISPPQSIFEAEPEILENSGQKPLYLRVGKVIRNNFKYLRSKSLKSFSAKLRFTSI